VTALAPIPGGDGLPVRPGDADLQKLRATCAEKLQGQQQRRLGITELLTSKGYCPL